MIEDGPDRLRVLVAGVGNIFLGDDAFGVEVAQRLARRSLPEGVRVVDFGIRGLDLVYALLDGYETVVLVDAVPRGGVPGTLYLLETDWDSLAGTAPEEATLDPHNLDPVKVLRLARALGSRVRRVLVFGCEPVPCGEEQEMQTGLSDRVRAAVDLAVPQIEALVGRLVGLQTASAG